MFQILHVAMEIGLYHQLLKQAASVCFKAAWRVVSEDSLELQEPFLLIVRTSRIVTAFNFKASTGGYTGVSSIWPGLLA